MVSTFLFLIPLKHADLNRPCFASFFIDLRIITPCCKSTFAATLKSKIPPLVDDMNCITSAGLEIRLTSYFGLLE